MIQFIDAFLKDRFIKVRVGNTISSAYELEEGVPQGSVLSVTCFAVAINSIVESVSAPVRASLFVDDLSIYVTTYDAVSACNFLQKSIDSISKWADENGFRFSASKTVAVRFTRCSRREIIPNIRLKDTLIPYEREVKFLGMIFDSKLTWSSHIDSLKVRVKQSLNILKVVSGYDWGADKKSLLRLYDSLCRSKLEYGCQIYSSACMTKLKELDVVHNAGLRICSGALKTSPIESLYIDTDELPLELRREELGLRYISKVKSTPENPVTNCLKHCNTHRYEGTRSSKPFFVRMSAAATDPSILNQKVKEVRWPEIPPWKIPDPIICKKCIVKKSISDQEAKARFIEHDHQFHSNSVKIFTDGSKMVSGVGCAVIHEDCSYVGRLSNNASIFTAELTAIVKSLELINTLPNRNFTIYSDSNSALMTINQYNSQHPIVQRIQEWLYKLSARYKSVSFCWVPAHVGIPGNELADDEAKSAITRNIAFHHIPSSDMKWVIRDYIKKKWQARWSAPDLPNNKKYRNIRKSIDHWPSSFQKERRYEIALTRLRIGHTRLTHQYILEGSDAPTCVQCDELLSVEHILVHCPRYSNQRRRFNLLGKSLQEILGDDADIDALFNFLKAIALYKEI